MGYTKQAIIGVSWTALLRYTSRFLTLVRISILARIFTPHQFGIFSISSLALSLIEILAETGINIVLIQKKENTEKYINTAWIISIIRGVLIAIIILVSSPFIADFFNAPESLYLLMLISIVPFIRGFINPSVVFYQKDLRFQKEFYFKLLVFIIESIALVAIALATGEILSIVAGMIIGAMAEVVFSFIFIPIRPSLKYEWKYLQEILSQGKWITLSGIFNYLFHNADNAAVGKLLSIYSLGLYQMAYKISIIPITEISDVISKVTFPVYVKIAHDKERLRRAFLKSFILISVFSLLFGSGLIFFSDQIVSVFLGEKWLPIMPILKILALFGIIRGISGSTSALFLAVGKQKYVSLVTFTSFLVLIVLLFPLILQWGIVGASLSALFASIIVLPLITYFTIKVLYVKR